MSKPIGTAGGHPADDSDLEDLLASKAGGGGSGTDNVDINLDHLTRNASSTSYGQRYQNYYGPPAGICAVIYAHCCLFFAHRPAAGLLCTIMGIAACVYFFIYLVDPSGKVGEIKHDWTTVSSELDLKAGDIDHWCIGGGDSSCRCEDPLIPADRGEYKSWVTAHAQNKKAIAEYLDSWEDPNEEGKIDVAFLGESLIEEMDGRWLGMTKGEHLEELAKLFNKHFKKAKGGAVEGVAMGIAGDTAPNVLWRLLHGEMPYEFNPKVWWISLGMNDLARMKCSEEVVIMGIIRVVEEIKKQKPDAKIVINSLLPMHDFRSGLYPQQTDYRDAFRQDVLNRQRGWRGKPQVNVPPSHIARNPNKFNKQIQGEPEEGAGKGRISPNPNPRRDRFPGGKRRLMEDDRDWMEDKFSSPIERELKSGMMRKKQLSPKEQEEKEKAMREAAMAKHRERMEKLLAQRVKRDRVNPLLRNKQTYKKLDPKKFFMRKTQVPLWPAITAINNALKKFADKHDHVSFFDATYLFTERNGPRSYMLLSDMISPRGHPTDAGFQRWETAVAKKLHYMLDVKPGQKAEKKAAEAAAAGWQSQPQIQEPPQVPPAMPTQQQRDEDDEAESKTEDEAQSKTKTEDEEEEDDEEEDEKDDEEEEEEEEEEEPQKKVSTVKKVSTKTAAAPVKKSPTQMAPVKRAPTKKAPVVEDEEEEEDATPVKRAPTKKAPVVEDEEEEEDATLVKRGPTKKASVVEDEEEEEDVAPVKTMKKPSTKKKRKPKFDDEDED